MLADCFAAVEVSRVVALTEDHPTLGFRHIFSSRNKLGAILRWGSTLVLQTACFTCSKE